MSGHDKWHWWAPFSTDHFQSLARLALMRAWQAKWDSAGTGKFSHSIFPAVTLQPWFESQNEEWRFVCTVSRVVSGHCSVRLHLGRFQIVEDLMCVCAGDYETVDHLIWHCERFRLERHRLIVALATLNVSIGNPHSWFVCIEEVVCREVLLDFLRRLGIKLCWFGPSSIFEGLEMYSLGP
jgi:hypothetical protein